MLLPLTRTAVATSAAAPVVNSISPTSGPASGGTTVTIKGNNFSGNPTVYFGSKNPATVLTVSTKSITATSPAGSGTVDVTVTTPGGTSSTSGADKFTYVPAPVVNSVSPTSGPVSGTTVTITGSYLAGATAVYFGSSNNVATIISDSNSTITATSPNENPGTMRVHVTTTGGTSDPNNNGQKDQFTYVAAPTVTGVTPNQGPLAGGTTVTISGTNFISGSTTVYFGSKKTTGVTVNSSTSISATSPSESVGTVDVTVTTPGGTSTKSSADYFTFLAAPTVTKVSPNQGSLAGDTSVTITGTSFVIGNTTVYFGSNKATGVTVNSNASITVNSPAGSGTVDVTVTTPGGTSSKVSVDKFTYVPAPVVSSISPTSGPAKGGTKVTITGTSFISGSTVNFGSNPATGVKVNSSTSITATSPAGSGAVDVTVTTKYGTSALSSKDKFSYITIAVYSDNKYSVPWGTGAPSTTAYVKCTGLTPGMLYTLEYEDPGNVVINKDVGCKAAADGTYEAAGFNLSSYTAAKYLGTWTVLLYSDGGSGQTGVTQNCQNCNPECSELLASTTFLVNTSNIPEFPAWFTGILVLGLCSASYFWMRKRHQVRTA